MFWDIFFVILGILVLYFIFFYVPFSARWWKCEHCGLSCKADMTFGNILDEKSNWKCYHCEATNYKHTLTIPPKAL